MRYLLAIILSFPILGPAQSVHASAPSREEISELLAKADEKVTSFEQAVKEVGPDLENQQTDILQKDVYAAATTHKLIRALQGKSPSAYSLVALLSALDDVTLNASKTATMILLARNGRIGNAETQAKLTALWSVQNSCSDISELILHATLRFIQVEEATLQRPPGDRRK